MLKNDFSLPMVQSFFGVGDMDISYYKQINAGDAQLKQEMERVLVNVIFYLFENNLVQESDVAYY